MRDFWRITRIALVSTIVASGMTVAAADAHGAAIGVSVRGVRIVEIYFDSPGPDNVSNKSLNGEWVKVKNTTGFHKNITGWTVHDSSSHRYTFPTTILAPHAIMRVHTGRGSRNAHNRYWGSTTYIWNNSGDTARLANANAVVVNRCSYSARFDSVRKFC
ncbi:MAG TPA: lamin tail domain-containing protein [Jatrophihabitans sp.]